MLEYKWNVLGITTIGVFMVSLDGSILNIAIPSISKDLKASFQIIQWVPIIYLLMMAITLISFGRLADLKGRKRFFLMGVILFTFSSFLSMLATSGEMLILFRAIQGIGSSLIAANAASMITEAFPHEETGKALGINVATIYLGLILGPVLGGLLLEFFTWRSIFAINLPIGITITIIGVRKLEESTSKMKSETFDLLGALIFGICLASFLLGLTLANEFGWISISIIMIFLGSAISFIIFIYIEKNHESPMLNITYFRKNRVFAAANLAALLNYISTSGVIFILSIYLQLILKISPVSTALLLLPTSLTMALCSPISGRLSDKIGTRVLCTMGMMIMAIGFFTLIFIIIYLPITYILISQLIIGIGIGLFSSPNNSAIMKSVEKKDVGIAAGTLSTMRVVGQSISVALLSAILATFISYSILNPILSNDINSISAATKTQFELGMHAVFIFSAIICILGAIVSSIRGKEI